MKLPFLRFLLLFLVASLVTVQAHATTYYVRTTGSDSNSGTSAAAAWLTITKAAVTMGAGDEVYVGAGTYNEQVIPTNNGTAANPIRFIADTTGAMTGDPGPVEITQFSLVPIVVQVNYIEFDGFRIFGGDVLIDGVSWSDCLGGRIEDCEIDNNGGSGLKIDNAALIVLRCSIHDNGEYGINTLDDTATITNCLIVSNTLGGIRARDMISATVWHTTIANNGGDGVFGRSSSLTITNSIIASNAGYGLKKSNGGSMTHTYNLVFGNTVGNYAPGTSASTGEISVDPLFVGGSDYHLQASSPAINAGTDGSSATTVDLDGNGRPVCAYDMGAYEHSGGSCLFSDVSSSVGFDVQSSDAVTSGAGLHWADYDNDGDLDAIVTGNNNARLYLSTNEGASFFVTNFGGGNYPRQGAMLDIDNDGDIDFWHSGETFHENNGSASFSVVGDLGFSDPTGTESTAAADVNSDGYCDVLMFSSNGNWFGTHEGSVTETLAGTNDASDGLNDGGDYGSGGYCSSGDVNNDGYLDFFYHYGTGKLFLSDGDGTYTENASGISVSTSDTQEVGSAWGDYDNDGDLDLFVPRFASGSTGYLWRNDSGTFVNVTVAAGISDTSGHRGSCWGDYDNDGDLDLYICVSSGANVLYQNQNDGTFTAVTEGADLGSTSQDAVFVDYDNDGDLDLAVTQESSTNVLLQNGTDDENYLKVRLIGHGTTMTNKAAIGVRVDLYESNGTTFIARREIGVARGLGGTEPIWVHFGGVTKTTTYVVKAHFASGIVDTTVVPQSVSTTISTVTINQMVTITERKPKVVSWREVDPR